MLRLLRVFRSLSTRMTVPVELRHDLEDAANRMRISAIEMTCASKSGHPTSSTSAAEVMSTLFFHEMKYDVANPKSASADRFVLSKRLNFIDVATGSLGQGLSCAAGMAYVGKYIDKASYRVFCLLGDGETAEGSVWEAAAFASHYKLDNLVAIVDANRLGQSQETSLGHKVDVYQARFAAFGFNAIVVNGHDVNELINAYETARNTKVGAIKARFHGSQKGKLVPKKPVDDAPKVDLHVGSIKIAPPAYKLGDKKHPQQFIECFIAEQNLVGVAVGAQCRDRTIPFTSTFAAFFTRATDQIRMAAVSFANLKCVGSHVGVSIGEDGPSQMALEDLAIFRAIPGSTVFYPSDGVSAERATELAANTKGIVFIRTGRPALPVLYQNEEPFAIGKAKIVKQSDNDKIVLIGAGVTLYECLKAAEQLEKSGVHACVIDPFTIKPLDQETIVKQAKRVGGKILTVEDHYPAGGIGEAEKCHLEGS
ncbi:Transketolase, pyridine binding domain protein [Teladorsagia circumcincta]|uniref:transketolase n=1 Tax=Teladorsagia circumcincta TaxID=45464 RepID=A0A2G9UK48_TELCI|nr:Transketolase, pyridine binding domain protein [Teladorsagia circumcincta]